MESRAGQRLGGSRPQMPPCRSLGHRAMGTHFGHFSPEYCYIGARPGFSCLEPRWTSAPHNTQKMGETKLRNVGSWSISDKSSELCLAVRH
jgi:hypothetical protein